MHDMTAGIVLASIFVAVAVGTVVATITLGGRTSTITKLGVLDKAHSRHPQTFSTEKLIDEELATGLLKQGSDIRYRTATKDASSSNHTTAAQQRREAAPTGSSDETSQQSSDRIASCDGKQPPRRSRT
ncbi:hypothetical protein [Leifsonia xyli]|uniref:hypothetical protein n=1 Tax=Leifsonia xyli TaxID=1575 RepID=UPI003D67978D